MLSQDLDQCGAEHRPHGTMTVTTGDITPNGYRLEVTCPCGVTFERWMFPEDAVKDLAIWAIMN